MAIWFGSGGMSFSHGNANMCKSMSFMLSIITQYTCNRFQADNVRKFKGSKEKGRYLNQSYYTSPYVGHSIRTQSHCADLASRLAPTLKSALVGVQSAYVGESSGYIGVSRAGRNRSGRHPRQSITCNTLSGPSPDFFKSGLSRG